MNVKLIIGIIIFIICCILAFLIPLAPSGSSIRDELNDCEGGICPVPDKWLH